MNNRPTGGISAQILEEASGWFIDFREGEIDGADRARFTHWLRKSPEHVSAYIQIAALWEDAPMLEAGTVFDAEALYALANADDNVTPLRPHESGALPAWLRRQAAKPLSDRAPQWVAAAAVTIAVIGLAVGLPWLRGTTYETAIGEQRSITLEDGSTLALNARSRVRVAFSGTQRSIDLLEGQAFFDVTKDAARPFVVRSDTTTVRAVGTQFDVIRRRTGTVVTVVEGRVAVTDAVLSASGRGPRERDVAAVHLASVSANVRMIDAGEQIFVAPTLASVQQLPDTSVATAWQQRKLVFDSAPLSEVVDEFNRYNAQQLILAGAGLADIRISASFSSVESGRLVRFLRERFGVRVDETDQSVIISSTGALSSP